MMDSRWQDKHKGGTMMDSRMLAVKMIEWGDAQTKANALAAEIEAAVLEAGKTQTVGNVRASYSNGRKTYGYQEAAEALGMHQEVLTAYTKTVVSVDWRKAWQDYGEGDPPVISESPPSVTVKLI